MAQSRSSLHLLLKQITLNVYFQPPPNVRMLYPCIRYERDDVSERFADNIKYQTYQRYMVTVICPDPDSDLPSLVAALPLCSFNRFYAADNLNHDVYTLYF